MASNKKVVLVTGGTGLVGKGIEEYVKNAEPFKNSAEWSWVFSGVEEYDLRDKAQTVALFQAIKPTHVIHLAARVGGLFTNMKFKVEFYREARTNYVSSV